VELEEDGRVYVEGKCPRCGTPVVTEILENDNGENS
jgi:phage FluMu protein Com